MKQAGLTSCHKRSWLKSRIVKGFSFQVISRYLSRLLNFIQPALEIYAMSMIDKYWMLIIVLHHQETRPAYEYNSTNQMNTVPHCHTENRQKILGKHPVARVPLKYCVVCTSLCTPCMAGHDQCHMPCINDVVNPTAIPSLITLLHGQHYDIF